VNTLYNVHLTYVCNHFLSRHSQIGSSIHERNPTGYGQLSAQIQHILPYRFVLRSPRFTKRGLLAGKNVSKGKAASISYPLTVIVSSSQTSVGNNHVDVKPRRRRRRPPLPHCPENLASCIILRLFPFAVKDCDVTWCVRTAGTSRVLQTPRSIKNSCHKVCYVRYETLPPHCCEVTRYSTRSHVLN
jgi:hypothetical protein